MSARGGGGARRRRTRTRRTLAVDEHEQTVLGLCALGAEVLPGVLLGLGHGWLVLAGRRESVSGLIVARRRACRLSAARSLTSARSTWALACCRDARWAQPATTEPPSRLALSPPTPRPTRPAARRRANLGTRFLTCALRFGRLLRPRRCSTARSALTLQLRSVTKSVCIAHPAREGRLTSRRARTGPGYVRHGVEGGSWTRRRA